MGVHGVSAVLLLCVVDDTLHAAQDTTQSAMHVMPAGACGFTPQYSELQAVYNKYSSKGLVVLGFPCNQVRGSHRARVRLAAWIAWVHLLEKNRLDKQVRTYWATCHHMMTHAFHTGHQARTTGQGLM
jgi:hypothetical protein